MTEGLKSICYDQYWTPEPTNLLSPVSIVIHDCCATQFPRGMNIEISARVFSQVITLCKRDDLVEDST
jgi:hypothetical protein